ncbi:MAG: heptosyltransferase I [Gammaproteobacteria bacterium]|nr:MAG: heptosyltransferase I [Gammaproteobacteria bacterium]TND05841.1 MAG: heptosyltransferase I [Gammaproteobacteria bacterium]
MALPFVKPPECLCILRLSALGDICHALPVVRTLQQHWPQTKLTWVIGAFEHALVGDIPDIEFIVFDKRKGVGAYLDLRRRMRGRRFDALLHMQMSVRASLASLLIPAAVRLGFDRTRAKDLQWLFTNHRTAANGRQHVMDSMFGFSEALGIPEHVLTWDIPIPDAAQNFALETLPASQPTLVISPCSSMSYRNWTAAGYAAVADYATGHYNMRVVLCGGSTAVERDYGENICALSTSTLLNLIGKTTVKQLLAVLRAAAVVIAPDSGPAHLATAVGTPVIGLYACTNPDRARPYRSADLVVNRYPEAVLAKYGKPVDTLPWGIRVRDPGTMERITPGDVLERLDQALARPTR